ncbi:hydroxyisourate hydrolase [Pollutimonas harenae]|uniref:5-hydroxyisourate hydrolase n=1 Tax=Pollutimonas harenae TaxID=657015 RepID=A0A853GUT5_9BURK|nr:hydroxyisourate hydrolase [Pollutimonas harenae]NYT84546.1 hydroxyisourate hydrolase [Pollutimonas harenae]TEA73060.1 hydroxyisourate hydrolase [Pollutimonas harenae]
MGKLTTHVLDTMNGVPAQGVRIELHRINNASRLLLRKTHSNSDGRCDEPLLQGPDLEQGIYELVFHAGDYFAARGVRVPEPRFVDQITLRFGVAHPSENYHVPLVVTPWTWSTYRGS